jgi:hypothetical protein
VAGAVGVAFVALLVSCGVANLLADEPEVWPAYQHGYATGQRYEGDGGKVYDRCERAALHEYGSAWSTEKAFAFAAGCGDGVTGRPMQSESDVQAGYGDLPQGD